MLPRAGARGRALSSGGRLILRLADFQRHPRDCLKQRCLQSSLGLRLPPRLDEPRALDLEGTKGVPRNGGRK